MVQGQHIEFQSISPQKEPPTQSVKQAEIVAINTEVEKRLQKDVIAATLHEKEEFISPIFIRPKKDGSFRLIITLKRLNVHVEYQHYKMHILRSAIHMRTNSYMASVDLKYGYYSVPIAYSDQKYTKFESMGQFYTFTCFPNRENLENSLNQFMLL